MKKGFTLIELLIVVAIIGILAAIAVPNFVNARVRAIIGRSVSDIRTIAQAIEMYRLDTNHVPFRHPGWPSGCKDDACSSTYNLAPLTSPIAYLSSIPFDPFFSAPGTNATDDRGDGLPRGWYLYVGVKSSALSKDDLHGAWRVWGFGPDLSRQSWPIRPYDASNGLNSKGDIIASEKTGFLTDDLSHKANVSISTDVEDQFIYNR
ncbi:MAG: prepilin-type N-terminal cleavage/methylation domain-containing protein [bacterium]|jgi:type II secretion system protein G|nr:prepilin-type N-terminal cleavage/methylation domain-containing protein [bacterium]